MMVRDDAIYVRSTALWLRRRREREQTLSRMRYRAAMAHARQRASGILAEDRTTQNRQQDAGGTL